MPDPDETKQPAVIAAFDLERGCPLEGPIPPTADALPGPCWIHLDRKAPETAEWVRGAAGLEKTVADALLGESTRPRLSPGDGGFLLNLRGVNLNPGADPEDMISIRMWVEPRRVVSLQGPRLRAVDARIEALNSRACPTTIGGLLADLADGLTARMEPVLEGITETLDELEDRVLDPNRSAERLDLIRLRQRVVSLHRYLAPQLAALGSLLARPGPLFGDDDRRSLMETVNRLTRLVEDLELSRARAALVQDELSNQLAERANQRVYAVTIIAAIFLPLTLVSGLLGMNVGGMPLASESWGFAAVTGGLAAAGALTYVVVRRLDWL